jgi:hypothetical protein
MIGSNALDTGFGVSSRFRSGGCMPRISIEGAVGMAMGIILLILDKMGIGGLSVYLILFVLAFGLCLDSVVRSEWARSEETKRKSRQFKGALTVCVTFAALGFWIFRFHITQGEPESGVASLEFTHT